MRYPKSINDVLDEGRKYKAAVLRAMEAYRKSGPWTGDIMQRGEKLRKLHRALCKAYDINPGLVIDVPAAGEKARGNGTFNKRQNEILLTGKISALTYLHEFAHAAFGSDEFKACAWSANLYKRIFPIAWLKLKFDGHVAVKPQKITTQEKE